MDKTPSQLIDEQIASYPEWQGKLIDKFRKLIKEADPTIREEWKWGTAVWGGKKLIAAASGFKDHIKYNFFDGAQLSDKYGLFGPGQTSKLHRGIDLKEGQSVDDDKLKDLILEAIKFDSQR